MKLLLAAMKLDFTIQVRYHLVTVSFLVTGFYCALLYLVNQEYLDKVLIYVLFSDPVVIGLIFIGALVLFERDQNTLEPVLASPLSPAQYLLSKAITLTLLSIFCCYAMALVAMGQIQNHWHFFFGAALTSFLFVLTGFVAVSNAKSMNQFILKLPLIMVPLALPVLNFLDLTNSFWLYAFPTQGTLLLFSAGIGETSATSTWELLYAYGYLCLSTAASYWLALRTFKLNLFR